MSKQEFEQLWELQERQAELRRHVVQLTSQITSGEKERAVLDITIHEMDNMPENMKTYVAAGKMFLLRPKDDLRSDFINGKIESRKRDDDRNRLRTQFLNKLREGEARIDELADQIEVLRAKASHDQNEKVP